MTPVTSSNVSGYHFDDGVLTVEFKGGARYSYAGVPDGIVASLERVAAEGMSVGSWISGNVVGKYPSTKLGAKEEA